MDFAVLPFSIADLGWIGVSAAILLAVVATLRLLVGRAHRWSAPPIGVAEAVRRARPPSGGCPPSVAVMARRRAPRASRTHDIEA